MASLKKGGVGGGRETLGMMCRGGKGGRFGQGYEGRPELLSGKWGGSVIVNN